MPHRDTDAGRGVVRCVAPGQVTVRGESAGTIAIGDNIGHGQLRAILVPILLRVFGIIAGLVVIAGRRRPATPSP
jgi:hypothetical protein